MKPKSMNDVIVKEMIAKDVDLIMGIGLKYAPNVDMKLLETKEDVDKEIREAVKMSKDINNLVNASPSFCAWF